MAPEVVYSAIEEKAKFGNESTIRGPMRITANPYGPLTLVTKGAFSRPRSGVFPDRVATEDCGPRTHRC
jgi:hypothetical protein